MQGNLAQIPVCGGVVKEIKALQLKKFVQNQNPFKQSAERSIEQLRYSELYMFWFNNELLFA